MVRGVAQARVAKLERETLAAGGGTAALVALQAAVTAAERNAAVAEADAAQGCRREEVLRAQLTASQVRCMTRLCSPKACPSVREPNCVGPGMQTSPAVPVLTLVSHIKADKAELHMTLQTPGAILEIRRDSTAQPNL